jgi:hypothetical protein
MIVYLLCLLLGVNIAGQDKTVSGVYQGQGQLYLVADENRVSGFFQSYRGYDFSTVFFLTGQRSAGKPLSFSLKTYYPGVNDTIAGKLTFLNEKEVKVDLERVPPGGEFSIKRTTDDFKRLETKKWKAIGFIQKDKVFLKTAPDEKSASSAYIVKDDCVALLDSAAGYSRIEFIGKEKTRVAWIETSAVHWIER